MGMDGAGSAELPVGCLELARLDGVATINGLDEAAALDVPAINRDVRAAFARRLSVLVSSPLAAPARILPVVAPAGAGKTHLLSLLYAETSRSGGLFVPVDLSGLSAFWGHAARAEAKALETEGPDGVTGGMRVFRGLLAKAGFSSLPATAEKCALWLNGLAGAQLDMVLKNLIQKLRKACPGLPEFWEDAVRAVTGLNVSGLDQFLAADAWLSGGRLSGPGADALGLASGPGPEAAFFAANSLTAAAGLFSVVIFDQLDAVLADHTNDPERGSPGDAETLRRGARELALRLKRTCERTARTMCVATCLTDVWELVKEVSVSLRPAFLGERKTLSPLTDLEVMESMIALRMRPAFAAAPGFTPPYPAYPFPRPFFESLSGNFPRRVIRAAVEHILRCLEQGAVSEWRPGTFDPGPSTEDPEIGRAFQEARLKHLKSFPAGNSEPALWREALEAFAGCAAAERGYGLPEADRPWRVERSLSERLSGPALSAVAHSLPEPRRAPPPMVTSSPSSRSGPGAQAGRLAFRPKTLYFCIVGMKNPNSTISRVKLAIVSSAVSARLRNRLVILCDPPPPTWKKTIELFGYLRANGGYAEPLAREAGALMLALREIAVRFPDSWEEWAAREKPVAGSGFLREHLDWLMESE
ncbi:MAG: ATP-binding protein [Deltaproteobacteria bacterium]|jgi:hypothetical protein|nr:ATP-binding protein [Deltaproteobacteria bacterium]